jgi:hypothetical protein
LVDDVLSDAAGVTVTVAVAVFVHPAADVPVTVYVMVDTGDAVTVELVDELSAVEGVQL